MSVYIVIMAGGVGSRFWPYSRRNKPKQFLDILGTGKSLLQMTYQRFAVFARPENILVVTHHTYYDLVKKQLPQVGDHQLLLEPSMKNTAPCIAYACYKIWEKDKEASIVITPSDHIIFNESSFEETIDFALQESIGKEGFITIGIQPTRPDTGYGYIRYEQDSHSRIKSVINFTEKPSHSLAKKFVDSKQYVWNSGIFIGSVASIKKALEAYQPEIAALFKKALPSFDTDQESVAIQKVYEHCPEISIDYGVIEKADSVYVVPGNFSWSDLGSWNALYDMKEKDTRQNVIEANAIVNDCSGSFIKAPDDKLVVAEGLEGYLIAIKDNVTLICKKDTDFRKLIKEVEKKKGEAFI